MLQLFDEDSCCGPALSAALFEGSLDAAETWVHEDCGCSWIASTEGPVRVWRPVVTVEVF